MREIYRFTYFCKSKSNVCISFFFRFFFYKLRFGGEGDQKECLIQDTKSRTNVACETAHRLNLSSVTQTREREKKRKYHWMYFLFNSHASKIHSLSWKNRFVEKFDASINWYCKTALITPQMKHAITSCFYHFEW